LNKSTIIKQILPWLITILILVYLGTTTDLVKFWATLKEANFIGFIPVVIAVVAVVFLFDSACLTLLFRRFNAPLTFREMLPLKGASYVLGVVNYNAGAAAIALYFKNEKGVPFLQALGSMLWLNFIDIVALSTLMLGGIWISGVQLEPTTHQIVLWMAVAIYAVFFGSCIFWNAGFDFFILSRCREWPIFSAFKNATLRDYAQFIPLRVAFVLTYVISQWVAMPFFGLDASLQELILYVPVLTFIGTIPLTTVAGLGTVQVLMREFFVGFAPDGTAQIDAYSTTTILAFVFCRIAIGLYYIGRVSHDISSTTGGDQSPESTANSM
jgi:hypothetical protein